MPRLLIATEIDAPADVCFDLMRDSRVLDASGRVHCSGSFSLGQNICFESVWLGFDQRLLLSVVEFDRPRRFVDEMVEGSLASFVHAHEFTSLEGGGTLLHDTVVWSSRGGILGKLFDAMIFKKHMRDLVSGRNARLKQIAEENGD